MSSRASEGPSISGRGITVAGKRVKRSRSNTPEGGLAAQQYDWDDPTDEGLKTEPVKSEWQGFTTRHAQDHQGPHPSDPHDAAGTSDGFAGLTPNVNGQHTGASEHRVAAVKQEHSQVVNVSSKKRTGLKVKLKFKSG